MDRQYLYVIAAIVAVVILAHVFGGTKPAATPAPAAPATGTKALA